jgi:hypothetical protein
MAAPYDDATERMVFLQSTMEDLLPMFLIFGALALMLVCFQRRLDAIRAEGPAVDSQALPLRRPGESILDQIDRAAAEFAAYGMAAVVIPLGLILTYLIYLYFSGAREGALDVIYLFCLALGFFFYGCIQIFRLGVRKKRLSRVYAGLQTVAREVNRLMLSGYHVYHDFPSGRFFIDHIVVGPNGVFAIQSRTSSYSDNGSDAEGGENRTTAFYASWLANWLLTAAGEALHVQPVLTRPDGTGASRLAMHEVLVVDPAQIAGAVRSNCIHPLAADTIQRLCAEIESKYRRTRSATSKVA